MGIPFADDRAL